MKNLILITSEFPYLDCEPYLLTEYLYLQEYFRNIYIFTTNANSKNNISFKISNNTLCFPLSNSTSIMKYLRYSFHGFFCRDEKLKIRNFSPKKIASSIYIRGRAYEIANKIYQIIKCDNLDVKDVTIYSFRFAYQAIATILLAEKLIKDGNIVKSIARAHGYDLYWERNISGYLPYQNVLLENLDECYVCSEYGKKYLLNKYSWSEKKIKIARLGTIDYGLNPYKGEKTIVTCGNLIPLKRITLFAEAFAKLAIKNKELKWICIGSGKDLEKINYIITKAGINQQVIITGNISNKRVMELYRNIGIKYFCNVSISEGVPVSIMEAMSFGIPIIATNVGGTSELVDNSNGLLLPSELSKDELYEYLVKILSIPENKYIESRIVSRHKWKKLASADKNYRDFCKSISQ